LTDRVGAVLDLAPADRVADMLTTKLLRLSDEQLTAVMAAAKPLSPPDRSAFLEQVAQALQAAPEIGDGVLHRTIATLQRQFLSASTRARDNARKWS
jgi:hypothetical protein